MADKSEKILQNAKNDRRRKLEIPISYLTPEAREDAQKVAKQVWIEGMKLLAGKDKSVRLDPQGNPLIIEGKKWIGGAIFEGADLQISRYSHQHSGELTHTHSELYHFYPNCVLKTTDNQSTILTKSGRMAGGAPKELTTEKHEANRDELTELLEATRKSVRA